MGLSDSWFLSFFSESWFFLFICSRSRPKGLMCIHLEIFQNWCSLKLWFKDLMVGFPNLTPNWFSLQNHICMVLGFFWKIEKFWVLLFTFFSVFMCITYFMFFSSFVKYSFSFRRKTEMEEVVTVSQYGRWKWKYSVFQWQPCVCRTDSVNNGYHKTHAAITVKHSRRNHQA